VTRGQFPQRAGLPGLNGGGAAAAVPTSYRTDRQTDGRTGDYSALKMLSRAKKMMLPK